MPDVTEAIEVPPATGDAAPPTTPRAHAPTHPRLTDRITREVGIALGLAWFLGYTIISALEPETSHEMPVIGLVLGVALLAGILVTAVGLVARRRWGLTASLASSGLFAAGVIACPTTGHHDFGLWWYGQMIVVTALVVASVLALRGVGDRGVGDRLG